MLQVAERGRDLQVAKRGLAGNALQLRVVHDQVQSSVAGTCSEDRGRLKQTIHNRIGEIRAVHAFHGSVDRGRIEQVTLEDLCALLLECFRSLVEPMNKGPDRNASLEQKMRNRATGRSLQTAGSASDENWMRHE